LLSRPHLRSRGARPFGDQALRRSWYLFILSYPWHLVGGGVAYGITWLSGGDFGAGEDVPPPVYPALYVWMIAPLVAAIVVGVLGWVRGHRAAAIIPALVSAAMIGIITVFGYDEFFG
jgi:fatty acid desaturase